MAKMITLRSSDGVTFPVEEAMAGQSRTIKDLIEVCSPGNAIPLPKVTGATLARVIEYFKHHHKAAEEEQISDKLKAWDAEFVNVDRATLYHLLMAANYLDIKSLMDLTCKKVADMIRGKSPEEIRRTFNIKCDFTPEEEQAIKRENAWALSDLKEE